MPDDAARPEPSPAVAPEPDDRPPREEPDEQPDLKLAGATGWQALAPPGKPDGEVDTRPQAP
jgi:hypothetical protein